MNLETVDDVIVKLKFAASIAEDSENFTWVNLCNEATEAIEFLKMKYLMSETDAINLTGALADKPFWISVKDRLPERSNPRNMREYFIVAMESGTISTVAYEFDDYSAFGKGWHQTGSPITHWMYLPKHPREMEQNGYY